jgi:hypothetical protein
MGLLLEYFPITSLYALIIVGAVTASNIIANYILYSWCMLNALIIVGVVTTSNII